VIREAVVKPEAESGIEEYIKKGKSITCYDLANRFNIRMSVARKILREKELEGAVVPYIREGGFVVYTTPSELEKRERGAPIMVADALEEVASSVPKQPVITEEMDLALAAASSPEAVKPSKLTRKRREAGEKKERKDTRPEVIVEPLDIVPPQPKPELELEEEVKKKKAAPKKKAPKKAEEKAAPKKKTTKKAEEKAAPKKKTTKKAEEKAAPKKKAPKKAEEKAAPKKKTTKKAEEKAAPKKKTTKKKE
jgi:hypothetical protein